MQNKSREWCRSCCTQHALAAACPADLSVTGSERHGWFVRALTPAGIETYGVLLAASHELWRARIVTHPDILWLVPGSRRSMKFVGASPDEAERKAARLILDFCRQRGYRLRSEGNEAVQVTESIRVPQARTTPKTPAPRKMRFLPVRFGVASPSEIAGTGNLSETGLFIITEAPLESSKQLVIRLKVQDGDMSMTGRVRWNRKQHPSAGTPGMGIQLLAPPPAYVNYVRTLD